MYICIHIFIYTYLYKNLEYCAEVFLFSSHIHVVCVRHGTYTYTYVHTYIRILVYIYIHVCISVNIYVCVCIYINIDWYVYDSEAYPNFKF